MAWDCRNRKKFVLSRRLVLSFIIMSVKFESKVINRSWLRDWIFPGFLIVGSSEKSRESWNPEGRDRDLKISKNSRVGKPQIPKSRNFRIGFLSGFPGYFRYWDLSPRNPVFFVISGFLSPRLTRFGIFHNRA